MTPCAKYKWKHENELAGVDSVYRENAPGVGEWEGRTGVERSVNMNKINFPQQKRANACVGRCVCSVLLLLHRLALVYLRLGTVCKAADL